MKLNLINISNLICIMAFYLLFATESKSQSWTNNGPYGGYIVSILADPVDTNIVYAGAYGGGIFKSIDGGESWNAINNGLPVRTDTSVFRDWKYGDYFPIINLHINPQNHENIYAGTLGAGLVQSSDGGMTWEQTNTGFPSVVTIDDISINPNDPLEIFAGVEDVEYDSSGLFLSRDGGFNWQLVDSIPSGPYWYPAISHVPGRPDSIYVAVMDWIGLLRSPNGGIDWDTIGSGQVLEVVLNPFDIETIWTIKSSILDYHSFISYDEGKTWKNLAPDSNTSPQGQIIMGIFADSEWNMYMLKEWAGNELWKSVDSGSNWTLLTDDLTLFHKGFWSGNFAKALDINPLNTRKFYIGTKRGVLRSINGGETFTLKNEGMINSYINAVEAHPNNPSIVYAGGDQGFWKSLDNGVNWDQLSDSEVNFINIDPKNPDTLYWGGDDYLYRSYDAGLTKNVIDSTGAYFITFEIHPDSSNIIYAGKSPSILKKSEDYGDTWTEIFKLTASFSILDIALDKKDLDIIYISTGSSLYRSLDRGEIWERVNALRISSIALDPDDPNIIYMAGRDEVYRSEDGGLSYESIKGNIRSSRFTKIALNPYNSSQLILGSADNGIYISETNGDRWDKIPGDYNVRTKSFKYLPDVDQLFVATQGGGVWRANDFQIIGVESEPVVVLPDQIRLNSAYPNPFNATTTISFQLPSTLPARLSIYSVDGRRVKQFPQRIYDEGTNTIRWDGKNNKGAELPSGIYFVQLKVEKFSRVQKITLLK